MSEQSDDEIPRVTFAESAAETVIEAFGWTVEDGIIVDAETGDPVSSTSGDKLQIDELAGIVSGDCGKPVPLKDNFADIVDHVRDCYPGVEV